MKLTKPTPEGHYRPERSYLMEYERVGEELDRGPRLTLLTRLRLWLAKQPTPRRSGSS